MGWFNYYGLAVMAVIMIPNVVYAVTHKGEAPEAYRNRAAIIAEQIGRYGCFVFMILMFRIRILIFGSAARSPFIYP